eukprot:2479501-Pleurochrysis_carterae.AAC.6
MQDLGFLVGRGGRQQINAHVVRVLKITIRRHAPRRPWSLTMRRRRKEEKGRSGSEAAAPPAERAQARDPPPGGEEYLSY